MKRYIGLRNIVTSKSDWKYLMLYEIDGHDEIANHALEIITDQFRRMETSWIIYKTLNGYHFVGLTPMSAQKWGNYFQKLQNTIPEYFSGQTLRVSLKEGEKQELVNFSFRYPYLQRLARVYIRRFEIPESNIPHFGESPDYSCVFEKYWTGKIR